MTSRNVPGFVQRGLVRLRRETEVLRLDPFDTSTPAGRSKERYRRAALSAVASFGAKGIAFATTFISVPLTLGYLGTERFGIWAALSALATVLWFTDLGIGNSLLNAVAHAAGRGDRDTIRKSLASGIAMLVVVAVVLGLLFAVTIAALPWAQLFNLTSPVAIDEVGPAAAALAACFLVGMPIGAFGQVRLGLQEGYVNSIFVAAGNVAALALVIVAIQFQLGLPWLVLGMAGAPVIASGANGVALLIRSPWLRPRLRDVRRTIVRSLMRIGLLFLVLQFAVAVAFTSNTVIAAVVIGPAAAADYAVVSRLFLIPTLFVSFFISPLWPAYREALSRGDSSWIRSTFNRSIRSTLVVTGIGSAALVVLGMPIIELWLGNSPLRPPFGLILAMGIWTPLYSAGTAVAMLLNGAQVVRFQVVFTSLMAAGNVVLSVFLASTIGVAGVVWGSVITYTLLQLIPDAFYLPRLFAHIDRVSTRADH